MVRRKSPWGKLLDHNNVVVKGVRVELAPSVHAHLQREATKRKLTVAALTRILIEDFLAGEKAILNRRAIDLMGQVWEATRAQPFRPFLLKLSDGRNYNISHADSIRVTPSGRERLSVADPNGIHHIDPVTIVAFETLESPSPSSQQDGVES
jgi:hypothetical protein